MKHSGLALGKNSSQREQIRVLTLSRLICHAVRVGLSPVIFCNQSGGIIWT